MIKCPNPQCGSLIPDDSKFCPDCGKPVKNENEIRKKAGHIANTYKNGYDYYVSQNILPHYSIRLTIEYCEKIISMETTIKNRDKEINDNKYSEGRKNRARRIIDSFPRGYEYWVSKGVIQRFSDFFSPTWEQIIANEQNIIQKQREIEKSERDRIEAKRREELKARAEAGHIRLLYTRKDYSKAIKYFVFLVLDLGLVALYTLYTKDDKCVGFDAFIQILPFIILILLSPYFGIKCFDALLNRQIIIDEDGIKEWKRQNPNNPACKYL